MPFTGSNSNLSGLFKSWNSNYFLCPSARSNLRIPQSEETSCSNSLAAAHFSTETKFTLSHHHQLLPAGNQHKIKGLCSSCRHNFQIKTSFKQIWIPTIITVKEWLCFWKRKEMYLVTHKKNIPYRNGPGCLVNTHREQDSPVLVPTRAMTEQGKLPSPMRKNTWRKAKGQRAVSRKRKRKRRSELGVTQRREGIANCKTDKKLAKMTTIFTGALIQIQRTEGSHGQLALNQVILCDSTVLFCFVTSFCF